MMDDSPNKLNPLEQCFRCGYKIAYTETGKGVLLHGAEDVLRYGPGFVQDKYELEFEIDEDDIVGQPLLTCSVNCALDSISYLLEKNPEQFTIHCIVLSGAYNVQIPGLPQSKYIKKHILSPTNINNDPKKLKRWGGTLTYEEYRKCFICPTHVDMDDNLDSVNTNINANKTDNSLPLGPTELKNQLNVHSDSDDEVPPLDEESKPCIVEDDDSSDSEDSENVLLFEKNLPDDDDIPTDPTHNYAEIDLDVIPSVDDPEAEDGDFDFIPSDMLNLFQPVPTVKFPLLPQIFISEETIKDTTVSRDENVGGHQESYTAHVSEITLPPNTN